MRKRCSECGTIPSTVCDKYGHALIWQGERWDDSKDIDPEHAEKETPR